MRDGIELEENDDPTCWEIQCDRENFQRFRDIVVAAAELKEDDDPISIALVETIQISQKKSDVRSGPWAIAGCFVVMILGLGVWIVGLITIVGWFRN